jgi:hypothetical protein
MVVVVVVLMAVVIVVTVTVTVVVVVRTLIRVEKSVLVGRGNHLSRATFRQEEE